MAKQKNKFVFVILTVIVFAMLLTFAACNNQESYKITIHPNNGEADIVWELGDEIPTLKKVGYLFKGFFLDEQFSKEIVFQNLQALDGDCEVWVKWINCPHEHLSEWVVDKAATCTEKGQRHKNCSDCAGIAEEEEISALNHDIEHHKAKAATCTEIGWDAYDTCKRDGCEYTTYAEIPALNHDIEHHEAKAATCAKIGWEAYDACKRDGCNYTTYVEIPASHNFDENGVCTVCGYFDSGLSFTLNADGESYSVSGIGSFAGTELVIPKVNFDTKPVTSIAQGAFSGNTGLTSVTIPDSVTTIGLSVFFRCTSLTSIAIPDSITSIGDRAFYNCTGLTNIAIPDNVTTIGNWAFAFCTGLTNITIPNSVTSTGDYAFYGCTGLTSIEYDGTIDQWLVIEFGESWDIGTGKYVVHCSDGTVAYDGTVTIK